MKPPYPLLLMGAILLLFSSCGPAYTVTRYGVKARLVDAGTHQPLERVKTRMVIDRREFDRTTDRDGLVNVCPDLDWHLSWLGGPAWMGRSGAGIRLEAEGYQGKSFQWESHHPLADSPFREESGVVDLGSVALERP